MNFLKKRYQYWWFSDYGYHLEEFDDPKELLDLIASFPTHDFYITERIFCFPELSLGEDSRTV